MPERRQRKRVKDWRKPEGAVIVDRTTRFGNPFTVADAVEANYEDPHSAAVAHHAAWLDGHPDYPDVYVVNGRTFDRRWVWEHIHELAGRDLLCPCAEGSPCHGDTLIVRANRAVVSS